MVRSKDLVSTKQSYSKEYETLALTVQKLLAKLKFSKSRPNSKVKVTGSNMLVHTKDFVTRNFDLEGIKIKHLRENSQNSITWIMIERMWMHNFKYQRTTTLYYNKMLNKWHPLSPPPPVRTCVYVGGVGLWNRRVPILTKKHCQANNNLQVFFSKFQTILVFSFVHKSLNSKYLSGM